MKLLIWDDCTKCDEVKAYIKANNISDVILCHESERAGREFLRENPVLWKPCLLKDGNLYFRDSIIPNLH